jgi:hypothetical protein
MYLALMIAVEATAHLSLSLEKREGERTHMVLLMTVSIIETQRQHFHSLPTLLSQLFRVQALDVKRSGG